MRFDERGKGNKQAGAAADIQMRRATKYLKQDANHRSICNDLRDYGVDVVELFDPVDAVGKYKDFVAFIEIKVEGSKAKFTRPQVKFIANTRWPVMIIKTAEQGIEAFRKRETLTQKQKDALAGFLLLNTAAYWQPSTIEKLLQGE